MSGRWLNDRQNVISRGERPRVGLFASRWQRPNSLQRIFCLR
jgi:tRNA (Thr-GGU) A37 N-methylase